MMSSPTRLPENREWIDFAKGIAIVLVVLYHCGLFLTDVGLASGAGRIRSFLNFIPMPLFFFIAGLTARRMLDWSLRDLWRRRLLTLVYLYLLWSGIRVIFYLVVPPLHGTERSPTDPVSILLLPVWPTSSYWFIWALGIFTILAWTISRIPVKWQLIGATLLAMVSTTPGVLDTNNVGWDRVAQNFAFFLVALYAPRLVYRLAARVRPWHAALLMVIYATLALVIAYLGVGRIPGVILLECAVAVAMTIAVSKVLARVTFLDIVNRLGRQSFPLYLLHLFPIAITLALITPVSDNEVLLEWAPAWPYVLASMILIVTLYLFKVTRRFTWLWVSPFRRDRRASTRPAGQKQPRRRDPVVGPQGATEGSPRSGRDEPSNPGGS